MNKKEKDEKEEIESMNMEDKMEEFMDK